MKRTQSQIKKPFPKKVVLLPIELKNREFHAHLLLAQKLASNGFQVIIGSHAAIFTLLETGDSPFGIYLDKGTQTLDRTKQIAANVQVMGILDQELSPLQTRQGVYRERNVVEERFYPGTKPFVDLYFTVGPNISKEARKILNPIKIKEFGWPRLEILTESSHRIYEKEISSIKRRYGNFAIFVSSFALVQDFDRCKTLKPLKKLGWITETHTEEWWEIQIAHLERFLGILKNWRKLGYKEKIVIRPHLYEDVKSWKKFVKGIDNIEIVKKGEIVPWLHAATSVIHRGSTASLQAALIDKPVFALAECTPTEYMSSLSFSSILDESSTPMHESKLRSRRGVMKEINTCITVHPNYKPSELISMCLNSLTINETEVPTRIELWWKYLSSPTSWRRCVGLIRDEILQLLGFDLSTTQLHAIPWGITSFQARKILRKFSKIENEPLNVSQLAINLISIRA